MIDFSGKVSIFNINFDNLTMEEVLKNIVAAIEQSNKIFIVTPYSEMIMMAERNKKYRSILNFADLILPDGAGFIVASKFLGTPLKERITGVELTKKIIEIASDNRYKLFFLGSTKAVLTKLSNLLTAKYPRLNLKAYSPPFKDTFSIFDNRKMINYINGFRPNVLFVGFGSPKQEAWIADNLRSLNVNVVIGVGGTFDFLSGYRRRAPRIIQKLYLEWLYRLVQDPIRIRRQLVVPIFIFKILMLSVKRKTKSGNL